ncbi:hypothetical protein I549_1275 [Mycobacterium avium subsp. avium 2285 (R)]|nr:hypothetical protein I549_1275 [Mycobacterium avium subsp. avium 2285 (R)]
MGAARVGGVGGAGRRRGGVGRLAAPARQPAAAAFAFALPVLPVLLTLAILADVYL